jgi:hypothetical protein
MGRYDDALADFTRAIELDPSHGDYAVKRAEIHQLMGEREGTLPSDRPRTALKSLVHGGGRGSPHRMLRTGSLQVGVVKVARADAIVEMGPPSVRRPTTSTSSLSVSNWQPTVRRGCGPSYETGVLREIWQCWQG